MPELPRWTAAEAERALLTARGSRVLSGLWWRFAASRCGKRKRPAESRLDSGRPSAAVPRFFQPLTLGRAGRRWRTQRPLPATFILLRTPSVYAPFGFPHPNFWGRCGAAYQSRAEIVIKKSNPVHQNFHFGGSGSGVGQYGILPSRIEPQ